MEAFPSAAVSPHPATNPFQAPDFGEVETFLLDEDEHASGSGTRAARREAVQPLS
ncbi:hypothetical protein GCM10017667_26520 [Streptomyces filamentosus]|uniref:Uncharacterized protein n=1 Tax=Streptomyces filamentosus TaxID=67294 RepID=A0A919BLD4_STRFL|nr:hypothetical protein GCM10017667_26520 [Streptomyces filamentosus]